MIYVDAPLWEAHGTVFAHVISDASYDELHAFARRAGLDPRSWDGDHYDVPMRRYDDVLAAGARQVDGRTLVRLLTRSGLRVPKRKGERPLVVGFDLAPGLDVPHRFDLLASRREAPEPTTMGAVVLVLDAEGSLLLVRSRRRGAWEGPGGLRDPGETPRETAVRETAEETGVRLDAAALHPVGYERLLLDVPTERWPHTVNHLQVYATRLTEVAPPVRPGAGESADVEWAPPSVVEARCSGAVWWPLLARVLGVVDLPPGAPGTLPSSG